MKRWNDPSDPRLASTESGSGESGVSLAGIELPGLSILWHPDPDRVGERAVLESLDRGRAASISRLEPDFAQPESDGRPRPLESRRLSRRPVRVVPVGDELVLCTENSPIALRVDGDLVDSERSLPVAALGEGIVLELADQVVLLLHRLDPVNDGAPDLGFVGASRAMCRLRRDLLDASRLEVPVLLAGESGSGKELAARALHDRSPRSDGPFVAVNLAAIPESLAAAELFGAAKGAFTGAERREGYFANAEGGTLFLDEIGDAPSAVQPLLLRALESGEIQPVGAKRARRVDVRLVVATDLDLRSAVDEGRFRAPLLYRLEACRIDLPPLRARRDDLGRLLLHFLRRELAGAGSDGVLEERSWMSAGVVERLARHDWPGNVRELRNIARRLVSRCRNQDKVRLGDLPAHLDLREASQRPLPGVAALAEPDGDSLPRRPADIGEDELVEALRAVRWRPVAAARRLGIPRPSIYRLIGHSSRLRTAADLDRSEIEAAFVRHEGDVVAMAAELEVSERGLRRRLGRLGLL